MEFEIRAAEREDAAAIAAVHVASWRAGYADAVPHEVLYADDFESSRHEMWDQRRFNPGQRVSVCVRPDDDGDETVIGFAAYGPERERVPGFTGRGELYALYFHPDAWGDGSASALAEHADQRLRAEGFSEAVLWVLKNNPRARAFYAKHGWEPTGRGDEFVAGDHRLPEIEYHKVL